jgi:hypothetical protein
MLLTIMSCDVHFDAGVRVDYIDYTHEICFWCHWKGRFYIKIHKKGALYVCLIDCTNYYALNMASCL